MTSLQLDDIHYGYPDEDAPLFSGFSYSFAPGVLWCATGPEGTGKTTLLELIAGVQRPQHGHITLNERALTQADVALMTMTPPVFPELTREEHLELCADIFGYHGAERTQFFGRFNDYARRLRLWARHRAEETVSAGRRVTAAFAMTLARRTPVLLIEESVLHVDPATLNTMQQMIAEEISRRIVITATPSIEPWSTMAVQEVDIRRWAHL